MEIKKAGLGIRFELPDGAGSSSVLVFELLSGLLCAKDVSGFRLYAGSFMLDEGDSEKIYTLAFTNGSVSRMRRLFLKLDANARIRGLLSSYRPYIQTNVLRRAEGLTYFGEFDENGALHGGEAETTLRLRAKKDDGSMEKQGAKGPIGSGLRLLIAPDKFKGSISAERAAKLISDAAKRILPGCRIMLAPIADGGEGTVDALVRALDGTFRSVNVTGPNGATICAKYGVLGGDTAVLEMASASGLALVPEGERDPLSASSRGTGELIVRAMNEGMKRILIGIGGSATNDGGMGAAAALGVRFYGADGAELVGCGSDMLSVERMDTSGLHPGIGNCEIMVMCDVKNPMTGENGATYTYGAQKGADGEALTLLETGMRRLERLYDAYAGRNVCAEPGGGAAGGMGAMLAAIAGAKRMCGAEAVLNAVRFSELLGKANLVITGEGRLDATSSGCGKAVGTVVSCAAKRGVPVLVIAGSLGEGWEHIYDIANVGLHTCVGSSMTEHEIMKNAEKLLIAAAERAFRTLLLLRDEYRHAGFSSRRTCNAADEQSASNA